MPAFTNKQRTTAFLSILFVVIVWGSASSVTKYAVENVPPYFFAFLRNLVGSVCLLPFFLYQRKRNPQQPTAPFKKMLWMGLTGITFFYLFFNIGLYYTNAATGALIQGFIPIAIILLALIFLRERLNSLQAVGVFISVTGVILIGFAAAVPGARNSFLGNILMIFAILSWGVYTIIAKSMKQYDPVYLTTISTWIGTVGLLPAMVIELWGRDIPVVSTGTWMAILYLGFISSAICYILYNRVLKVLSAIQVGNLMNLDPIFGAIVAVLFLHESVTIWQIGGTLLVLLGVALTSAKRGFRK